MQRNNRPVGEQTLSDAERVAVDAARTPPAFDDAGGWRYAFQVTSDPASGHVDEAEAARRGLERVIPDLVKRLLELGLERLSEGPDNVRRAVGELKLPREALNSVLSQLDESTSGVYRIVAKEVRDFLGQKSIAEELVRALTALSFEIRTEVRFIPNEARGRPSPDVRSKVSLRRSSPPGAEAPESGGTRAPDVAEVPK